MDSKRMTSGDSSSSQPTMAAAGDSAAGSSGALPAAGSTTDLGPVKNIAPDDSAMIGQLIDGRYEVTCKLGEGGMGEVYAAKHIRIQKRVAIKLLRPEVTSNEEAVRRFEQEALAASSIKHPNIIGIEDSAKLPDGRFYLAMEFLEGEPLNDILNPEGVERPPPLDTVRALNLLIQSCYGLKAAHEKNIVHRDMKPENIFVTRGEDGREIAKLLDFGIAKVAGNDGANNLTKTGMIFGTPFYMAPEQAIGEGVDHRADIYAIGVIMYEIFTGEVPFKGESFMNILTKHITAEPDPVEIRARENGREIPPGIKEVIHQAMRKDADQRYQSMEELLAALIGLYRRFSGAGMSGYMQAHVPPQSGAMPAAHFGGHPSTRIPGVHTPPPGIHHTPSGPMMPVHTPSGPTPGLHPGGSGSMPVASHGSGPSPAGPYSGGYDPSAGSSVALPRQRSRAGLIAAVLVVLAVVGGSTAFVLIPSSGDDGVETDGNAGLKTDGIDGTEGQTPDGPDLGDPKDPKDGQNGVADGKGPKDGQNGVGDGQTTDENGNSTDGTNGTDNPPVTPPAKPVVVKIKSKPKSAVVKDQDGVVLGKTPLKVRVIPGQPVTYTVVKSRYQDEDITVDGEEREVVIALQKRPRGGTGDKGTGDKGTGDKGTGDKGTGDKGGDKDGDEDGDDGKGAGSLGLELED